jgi:hypothetical protein
MKKIRYLVFHGLLSAGMLYALISIVPLPASACTPTECANFAKNISQICAGFYGCHNGGHVISCNSTSITFYCNPPGPQCGFHGGGCT